MIRRTKLHTYKMPKLLSNLPKLLNVKLLFLRLQINLRLQQTKHSLTVGILTHRQPNTMLVFFVMIKWVLVLNWLIH